MEFNFLQNPSVIKLFDLFEQEDCRLYVVGGAVRDAFLGTNVSTLSYAVYFWIITLSLFIFSSKEFSRFRSEFDDVL